MSVLLPECLIRIIADVFEVSFDEVKRTFTSQVVGYLYLHLVVFRQKKK